MITVRCDLCGKHLEAQRSTRRWCSASCRNLEYRARRDARNAEARALLAEQTAAIIAGDAEALADVVRRAQMILPA